MFLVKRKPLTKLADRSFYLPTAKTVWKKIHRPIGETMMFCQLIEEMLKVICAKIQIGDFRENFKGISNYTLESLVYELIRIDELSILSESDYALLNELIFIRDFISNDVYKTLANPRYRNIADQINSKLRAIRKLLRKFSIMMQEKAERL